MTEANSNSDMGDGQSVCGSTDTADGEPCQRPASGGGRCFLHDKDGVPDDHGAPEGNANAVKHGLFADDVETVVDAMNPHTELLAYGLFENLMRESRFDFSIEYREHTTDFSGSGVDLDGCGGLETDSRGRLHYRVPVPQQRLTQAAALWTAAVVEIQRLEVAATLKAEQLQSKTTKHAQLDGNDEWVTVEEPSEHHLALPFSRLCRDMSDLLELGGIPVKGGDADDVSMDVLSEYPFGP